MPKYFSEKNKYVVDEPSLLTINGSVDIQYAGGTEHKDGEFTIQIGNIESYNPTEIESEEIPEVNPTPVTPEIPEEDDTPVTPDPTPSSGDVTFILTNNCGHEVRLSGRAAIHITNGSTTDWSDSNVIQTTSDMHGATVGASWAYNDIIIPVGGKYTWHPNIPNKYTSGGYYFMSRDKDPNNPNVYIYAIYLYSRIWRKSKSKTEGSTAMYRVQPLTGELKSGNTYYLSLYKMNDDATLDPDQNGKYVILDYLKTTL